MKEDARRYVVVICEGGMISHTEEPEGVELVHLDYDDLEYNDPNLRSMAGFERCASCSYAKDLHRGGCCVLRDVACSGWESTSFLIDDRPMTDLEGYELAGSSEETAPSADGGGRGIRFGNPDECVGIGAERAESTVVIHTQELETHLEPAFRYEAYAQPPWLTHGSGGVVGYSDASEAEAARQLKLMLLDLGVDPSFVVRDSRGAVIETD
ncbi:MAG: hypothetical protein WA982_17585 [Rubrobacteraceae bacterium]